MSDSINSSHWLRIQYILKNILFPTGKIGASHTELAFLLGLQTTDSITCIEHNQLLITEQMAETIHRLCPTCSKDWFLTGKGDAPDSPIPINLSNLAHPWWSSEFPSLGSLNASIIGSWERVHSFVCHIEKDPCEWEKLPANAETNSIWEFKDNGQVYKYEDHVLTNTCLYGYDEYTGHLTVEYDPVLVIQLTQELMVCLDWTNLALGRKNKDVYRRL